MIHSGSNEGPGDLATPLTGLHTCEGKPAAVLSWGLRMNAKISTGAAGLVACTNSGSCLPGTGKTLAAAALAAGLILLGLGENGRAADNALDARVNDAAKSVISAPPPPPPPAPMGVFG